MEGIDYGSSTEKLMKKLFIIERGFIFGELGKADGEKVIQKGVYCKMARGEMVRYLAGIGADGPELADGYNRLSVGIFNVIEKID